MKRFAVLLCAAALWTPVVVAQERPTLDKLRSRDLGSQLGMLAKWWPGQYDNHEQIVRQSGGGISPPTFAPFHRLHTDVRAMVVPSLGTNVVLIEQYADNDPAIIVRREIASFAPDVSVDAIRVRRFTLGTILPRVTGAPIDPAGAKPLGDACDLLLRYAGGQFEGTLASKRCPSADGTAAYELIVGDRYVWERGQNLARNGKVVSEMAPGAGYDWYQETRARPFTCNVFEDRNGVMAKTKFLTTVHLHDQGGESEIAWPDGRRLVFTIHNRAFTATPEREYPMFRIHEKGNPVPIAYAYAVDNSTRFGLNLGWFYVRCYEDSDIGAVDMAEAKK